jgi:hypothetical protein
VPAAAVIPAPIAYIKVVAVKKLVVGSAGQGAVLLSLLVPHCPVTCVWRRPAGALN